MSLTCPTVLQPLIFIVRPPPPPRSTLFPYTTLFRSDRLTTLMDALEAGREESIGQANATRHTMLASITSGLSTQAWRSEEHTSELQSRGHLVCRLLLEKKKHLADVMENRHQAHFEPR